MSLALIFPGQGSQAVGMGRAVYDAFAESRAVFDEVDSALGEKLSAVIFEGPEPTLTLTANAQPALMAVSIAVLRAMESRGFDLKASATYVAGHSLGEYSALAAAGALSVGETAKLLRIRGEAMQRASQPAAQEEEMRHDLAGEAALLPPVQPGCGIGLPGARPGCEGDLDRDARHRADGALRDPFHQRRHGQR